MKATLAQVTVRIDELRSIIGEVQQRTQRKTAELWELVETFDDLDPVHLGKLGTGMLLCKALADLLKAPVLVGHDGAVNPELPGLIAHYKEFNP
jgi:hypothetical protein